MLRISFIKFQFINNTTIHYSSQNHIPSFSAVKMFSPKTLDFINQLHHSNVRACIITAGAGSTAVSALMSVPGCSKTLLDAQVPYSVASTIELLDHYPQQYVSQSVAMNLSHAAYARAKKLAACPCNPPSDYTHINSTERKKHLRIVGLGATSAISTLPDRKGEDRVHACCSTEEGVYHRSLKMTKGLPRHVQEWMVSCVILQLLADVSDAVVTDNNDEGKPTSSTDFLRELCLSNIHENETKIRDAVVQDLSENLRKTHQPLGPNPFSLLLDGKVPKLLINKDGVPHFDGRAEGILSEHNKMEDQTHDCHKIQSLPFTDEPINVDNVHYLLYPGSFSPLHYGHTELARVATHLIQSMKNDGKPVTVTFEVATSRVDKKTHTTPTDLAAVAAQFTNTNRRVVFSTAKLFIDKAKMFPNHGFIVGVDTAARVLDPKYYDNSKEKMIEKLREIEKMNCYFIVAGRKFGSSGWQGMHDIETPPEVAHLFLSIPDTEFRVDISSTELREREKQKMNASSSTSSSNPASASTSTANILFNNNTGSSGNQIPLQQNRSPFPSAPHTPSMQDEEQKKSGAGGSALPKNVSQQASDRLKNEAGMKDEDEGFVEGQRQPSWALGGKPIDNN